MLIPHLHLYGDCKEAISLYEKAFHTKAETDIDYAPDGKIAHARMRIHGQEVWLNDALVNKDKSLDLGTVHLCIIFDTTDDLLACYEILKADRNDITPFQETPYSKLCGNFMDKFGVIWGFMVW